MEGELKFNFVLSESRRNGHDENVNHWRFFFLVSCFFISIGVKAPSLPNTFYS